MKHSCLINGYDALNITKLDILDDLAEIKVGVGYRVDGKELEGFPGGMGRCSCHLSLTETCTPADLDVLDKVEVVYATLPGWKTPITGMRTYEALPEKCKEYIGFVEGYLGVRIEWIGVGPGRESM